MPFKGPSKETGFGVGASKICLALLKEMWNDTSEYSWLKEYWNTWVQCNSFHKSYYPVFTSHIQRCIQYVCECILYIMLFKRNVNINSVIICHIECFKNFFDDTDNHKLHWIQVLQHSSSQLIIWYYTSKWISYLQQILFIESNIMC